MSKKIIIIALCTILAIIGVGFGVYQVTMAPISSDETPIIVEIPVGTGGYEVVEMLHENNLIRNPEMAKAYLKITSTSDLQANTYVLNQTMSTIEILKVIKEGTFKYVQSNSLTVFEGATYDVAAEAVAATAGVSTSEVIATWSDEEFLNELIDEYWFLTDEILDPALICPLDGFLYPNTYFVTDLEKNVKSITIMMLDTFDEEVSPLREEIQESGYTIFEFVTIASIVEAEALFEEDKAKIAGVFQKRLDIEMLMQSCSTVLYALGEKRIAVTNEDTRVESPYNTYKYLGLPIGPISNPASSTMEATLNPKETEALYFYAKEDGTVIYSETLGEHEQAIADNPWY